MKWIYDLSYDQLKEEIGTAKLKKYTTDQVFQWLYRKNIQDTDKWTNLSKTSRDTLSGCFDTRLNTVLNIFEDQEGTKKFLVQLADEHNIEAVLIPEKHHYTFCISTQVGCPLNCAFCATGRMGFKRNLSSGEIVSQVLLLKKELADYTGKINIVLMGMGEPLLNYDNLKKALDIIASGKGMSISPRNITLSTAGILEELQRFEKDFPKVKISFSLNAPDASLREQLMPISRKEKLTEILEYLRTTKKRRKHRVTFEYVLLKGVNDSLEDARNVSELLKGISCKINLIPYNENKGMTFETPALETVTAFSDFLHSRGYTVIVRWSKGRGIQSACGQLASAGKIDRMNYFNNNGFVLDDFQKKAIEAVEKDQSVLVSAPTGAGKTLIAEHLVRKCMAENRGVIYTAPIKALSNQKFREFQARFPDQVGIITGDVNIKPFSPLLIMTTEIFRNKVLESESSLGNHHWIIFDEIHYLDSVERGTVWEESLILLPKHMRFMGLSATIPNIDQFAAWLRRIHPHPIKVIKEDQRPVPLHFLFQCRGRICDEFKEVKFQGYGERKLRRFRGDQLLDKDYRENRPFALVRHLVNTDRLPCIYFSFSRKRCEILAQEAAQLDFLTDQERTRILQVYDEFCREYEICHEERTQDLRSLVKKGVAYHHAGIHPLLKEILERLFTGKLIKIIFTTETFALGINMPARTVALDELKKKYGRFYRALKVRDFYQMAGRSGRRGIDKEGYVYSRLDPKFVSYEELKSIFKGKPEDIRSRFNVSYATILNLYETYGEELFRIHSQSFYRFQEKNISGSRQLEQMKARLDILKHLGYIHDSRLTEKGHFAKKIHGNELPLAELFGYGVLEELTLNQVGILALAAVYMPRPNIKKPKLTGEIKALETITTEVVRGIHKFEKKMRLSYLSKSFYYDLSASLLDWMKQNDFQSIIEQLQVDEGEVIRYYRMGIQVLREMLETPASDELKYKIENAITLINRGVIDAEDQLKKTAAIS
jgi:23S rRNA (adenine(2503)-C(2))-methyltransferase